MFEYNMCAGFLGNACLGTRHIADTFGAGAPATTPALSGVRPCKWDWLQDASLLQDPGASCGRWLCHLHSSNASRSLRDEPILGDLMFGYEICSCL